MAIVFSNPLHFVGFCLVMIPSLLIIIRKMLKTKNSLHLWIICHLLILSIGIVNILYATHHVKYIDWAWQTNYFSWKVGVSGLIWAGSMIFLVIGVILLGSKPEIPETNAVKSE